MYGFTVNVNLESYGLFDVRNYKQMSVENSKY
jgi:hypothetical protein